LIFKLGTSFEGAMVDFVLWELFLPVSAALCKLSLCLGKDFTIDMAQKQCFLCHKVYTPTCMEIEDPTYPTFALNYLLRQS